MVRLVLLTTDSVAKPGKPLAHAYLPLSKLLPPLDSGAHPGAADVHQLLPAAWLARWAPGQQRLARRCPAWLPHLELRWSGVTRGLRCPPAAVLQADQPLEGWRVRSRVAARRRPAGRHRGGAGVVSAEAAQLQAALPGRRRAAEPGRHRLRPQTGAVRAAHAAHGWCVPLPCSCAAVQQLLGLPAACSQHDHPCSRGVESEQRCCCWPAVARAASPRGAAPAPCAPSCVHWRRARAQAARPAARQAAADAACGRADAALKQHAQPREASLGPESSQGSFDQGASPSRPEPGTAVSRQLSSALPDSGCAPARPGQLLAWSWLCPGSLGWHQHPLQACCGLAGQQLLQQSSQGSGHRT